MENGNRQRAENDRGGLGPLGQIAVGEGDQEEVEEKMLIDEIFFPVSLLKPGKRFYDSLVARDLGEFDVIITVEAGYVLGGELQEVKIGERA